jgi:hypothetical protein
MPGARTSLVDRLMDVVEARLAVMTAQERQDWARLAGAEHDVVGPHPERWRIRFDRGTWVISCGADQLMTVADEELQDRAVDPSPGRPAGMISTQRRLDYGLG